MKEYHLERINENFRNTSILLIMPLFFGGIVIIHLWNVPVWGIAGLVITFLSLLGIIICYFNTYESFILKIDGNSLIINKISNKKERKIKITDIAVIQYNKSGDEISALAGNKSLREVIIIYSKTGRAVFICSNSGNFQEFKRFFNDIRKLINAQEIFIYAKQIKFTKLRRSLFINPLYENSRLVKKLKKQSGFYYPLIGFLLIVMILIIILNLLSIYRVF